MAISFDADSVQTRITNSLRAKESWQEVLFFSTNLTLIQAISEEIAATANYDEYLTREAKWSLARNKSSVMAQSQILSYEAKRQISATGILKVSAIDTFDSPPLVTIEIAKYTKFSSDTGIEFLSDNAYNIGLADDFIEIGIVQGRLIQLNFIANGNVNEEVDIDNENIEDSNIEIYVNNVLWSKIDNLVEHENTDQVYVIENKLDLSGIYIVFGDDIFGKKLENGDIIKINYIETDGVDGEIISIDSVTSVDSPIFNISGDRVDIFSTNDGEIIGGKNPESIDSLKSNATDYFQAGNRAVSSTDYKQMILNDFSFVSKINVWGVFENNVDQNKDQWEFVPTEENRVFITALTTSFEDLSESQKSDISIGIYEKKPPTDILSFLDTDKIRIAFNIDAFVKNKSFSLSSIATNIDQVLFDNYDISVMNYSQNIFFSQYVCLIDEINGIYYHNSFAEIIFENDFQNAYVLNSTLSLFEIEKNSVKFYVENKNTLVRELVAIDDGVGGLTAEVGYTLDPTSAITYENGNFFFSVSSGLSDPFADYSVIVFYKTVDENLILKNRKQIFKYDQAESTINVQYTG